MFCKNCGARIAPNNAFCEKCGCAVDPEATQEVSRSEFTQAYTPEPEQDYSGQNFSEQNFSGQSFSGQNYYENVVAPKEKSAMSTKSIVVISLVTVLVVFIVFNVLVLTGAISPKKGSFLYDYKSSLCSVFNIDDKDDDSSSEEDDKEESSSKATKEDSTEQSTIATTAAATEPTTEPTTAPPTTAPPTTAPYTQQPYNGYYYYYDNYQNSEYLFPSDTQLMTPEFVATKSQYEINLLINEIYARHGYIFKMPEFYNYFIQKSWYHPTEPDMEKINDQFNYYESKNIDLLVQYRN